MTPVETERKRDRQLIEECNDAAEGKSVSYWDLTGNGGLALVYLAQRRKDRKRREERRGVIGAHLN